MKITVEASSLEELKSLLEALTANTPSATNVHIKSLPLLVRTTNCLLAEKIETLDQLAAMSESELLRVPNLGRKATNELRAVLASRGIHIAP